MAALNTHFKPQFTEQEREECFQWFEQHMNELPQTMLPIRSIRITDLPRTVRRMVDVLRKRMTNDHTFSGEFSFLLLIREKLREGGLVKD